MEESRTMFTFYSPAFNTTEEKESFINPGNFGDDLALWLSEELEKKGARIEKDDEFPGQEDFGWYVRFSSGDKAYCIVVGSRRDEKDNIEWLGWVERECGFWRSIFGGRNRNIGKEACGLVHQILSGSEKVENLRWHTRGDFGKGTEDAAAEKPY